MKTSVFSKSICILFALFMVMACSSGGSDGVPASPNISLSETSYDFSGVVLYNDEEREFRITNTGNADLTIGQISGLQDPFNIVTGVVDTCSGATLSRGETCSFRARFAPEAQAVFADQISITSNDPDQSTVTISLSGEGYGLNVWIDPNSVLVDGSCHVDFDITVSEYDGTILTSLGSSNFQIRLNDQLQTFSVSTNQTPAPVSLVLAIDWSLSVQDVIGDIRTAAVNFVDQLVTTTGNELALYKFNSSIDYAPSTSFYDLDVPADVIDAKAYIDAAFSFGTETHFYDTVYDAITRAATGNESKKVVVVLSDGHDLGSTRTSAEVIQHADNQNVTVFTIYFRDLDYQGGVDDYGRPDILEELADDTGGQYYDGTTANLTDVYQKIANILSNKYTVGFDLSSCPSGGTATLDVLVQSGSLYGQDSITVTFP